MNTSLHKNILIQILKDIYSNSTIATSLGFKGGTAAMLFYELDRFSVDLDFDLLEPEKEEVVFSQIKEIAKKYGTIKDEAKKKFGLILVLSYEDKARKIKIEINLRSFGSRYELKNYLGISVQVMVLEDMVAHKLMAMLERVGKTSRDVYDVWFFLKKRFPINKKIVEQRSGLTFKKALQKAVLVLEKMSNRNILDGLGDLLTPSRKDWARAKLKEEAVFLLKARVESER